METVDIKLPSELLKVANLEEGSLSEEAARLLALALYREDKVSLERAAELCLTPVAAFIGLASKRAVPPLRYSFEDLDQESHAAMVHARIKAGIDQLDRNEGIPEDQLGAHLAKLKNQT